MAVSRKEYAGIRSVKELRYQKRLIASKLEHQEVMIMYRVRNLWDYISPLRLVGMGLESLAERNRPFGILYKSASFAFNLLKSRRRK